MREAMSANEVIQRRLAEIDKTLLMHDEGLRDLYEKLMPLLEPGQEPERRKIGFAIGDVIAHAKDAKGGNPTTLSLGKPR